MDDALPALHRSWRPDERWHEWRRRWRLQRAVDRLVPPPADRFGAFGRSFIVPPARVETPDCIHIGDGVVIHEEVWLIVRRHFPDIEPRLVIGDRARVGRFCQLSVVGEVVIEPDVIIGDFVQIGDTFHPYESRDRMHDLVPPKPVRIGRGAVIGSHAVVTPGVTIGPGAYLEHHSVVGHDVAAGAVVAGNPARLVTPDRD